MKTPEIILLVMAAGSALMYLRAARQGRAFRWLAVLGLAVIALQLALMYWAGLFH